MPVREALMLGLQNGGKKQLKTKQNLIVPCSPPYRCCGTYFKTKCKLAERRGSVNCVVRLLWSTKYTLPVAVFRISQPGGRGPSSSQLTLLRSLKCKFENTIKDYNKKVLVLLLGNLMDGCRYIYWDLNINIASYPNLENTRIQSPILSFPPAAAESGADLRSHKLQLDS